jgi:hypothetical protein
VASLCSSARRELGDRAQVWQFGYEDLSLDEARGALQGRAPYDAILFGWASFSHVLDQGARERAIQVLDQLCPSGPLMLSFHAWQPNDRGKRPRPFERAARRVGQRLGELRGLPRADGDDGRDREAFLPHAGFIHRFSEEEIFALARLVQREVRWGSDQRMCGHATLLPAARR